VGQSSNECSGGSGSQRIKITNKSTQQFCSSQLAHQQTQRQQEQHQQM
jgi:hypothetical protein